MLEVAVNFPYNIRHENQSHFHAGFGTISVYSAVQVDLSILNQDNSDIVAAEFNKGTSQFVDDLSHVTGKAAKSRNRAIGTIITEDFPNLKLTYRAQYSPYVNYGIAKRGVGTHIGAKSFVSRSQLRDTIIHEELHHRWWKKGIINHHPQRSSKERRFYQIISRYKRMRGWKA